MIKADKYYIENLNNIRDNGCFDENPRPKYSDGTPAYTKFITQVFEEYDISKGEYPITTLRNTAIKTGIKELLAIYQKQTNTKEGFENMGVKWWESFFNEQGNIGRAYSYNLESHRNNEMTREVKKIDKKIIDKTFGETFGENDRSIYNVGYLGDFNSVKNFDDCEVNELKKIWINMFKNCYLTYTNLFVHSEWHSFETFLRDVRYLPQYHLACEDNFKNWILDIKYFESNCYSKYSCVFLTNTDEELYNSSEPILVTLPDKTEKIIINLSEYCFVNNIDENSVYEVLNGDIESIDDYIFKRIDDIYRYELSRNQVSELLYGLEKNPYGRRHIISFWNWSNIDKKVLVECAYETLWSVRKVNGVMYLDLTLIQRSSDYLVANQINKVQYIALQMMVAGHLGYKVGKFCHYVQNLHIYDRHMNALNELLDREPLDVQPKLRLKENKNFYEYTVEDFEIIGIENITKIKSSLELGI